MEMTVEQSGLVSMVTLRFRAPARSPGDLMSSVRSARLERQLGKLEPAADAFAQKVGAFVAGDIGSRSVKETFASSYGTFVEAALAAEREGLVTGVAVDAVRSVMNELRRDFTIGLGRMTSSVQRMGQVDQSFFGEASEKLQKLSSFWQQLGDAREERQRLAMTQ